MGELDAIGDAVTGGVLGRAVEPRAGEGADGHTDETSCLNCGAELAGPYCHRCGQHAHVHRTLGAFWHDLLHGVLHFEGKVWRTLPLLAWRPGELTRRYIDGERAKFVSPVALFLFSIFLLFAVGGLTGSLSSPTSADARRGIAQEIAEGERNLAQLQLQRADLLRKRQATGQIDASIVDQQQELAVMRGIQSGQVERISKAEINAPDWMREPIAKASKNPELLFYKLKTNAYKFGWALIPLSVPFLWLLFPFSRRFRLYDHTIFVTYSLCFMALLLVTAMLLGIAGLGAIAGFAALIPPFHMYRHLKGTYGLSSRGALVRTVLLLAFATVALGLFGLILFALGLFD